MTAPARAAAPAPPRRAAAAPRPEASRRPQRRPEPRRLPRRMPRVGGLWIPLVALMLGGIVWLNVTKLQITNRVSQTIDAQQAVQSDNARLRTAISRHDKSVLAEARRRLDMRPAEDVTFVRAPTP